MPLNEENEIKGEPRTAGEKLKRELDEIASPKGISNLDYASYFEKLKGRVKAKPKAKAKAKAKDFADVLLRLEPEQAQEPEVIAQEPEQEPQEIIAQEPEQEPQEIIEPAPEPEVIAQEPEQEQEIIEPEIIEPQDASDDDIYVDEEDFAQNLNDDNLRGLSQFADVVLKLEPDEPDIIVEEPLSDVVIEAEDLSEQEPEELPEELPEFEEAELKTAEQKLMDDLAAAMEGPPLSLESEAVNEAEAEVIEEPEELELEAEAESETEPEVIDEQEQEPEDLQDFEIENEEPQEQTEDFPELEAEVVPEDLEPEQEQEPEEITEELEELPEPETEVEPETQESEEPEHKTAEQRLMDELTAMGAELPPQAQEQESEPDELELEGEPELENFPELEAEAVPEDLEPEEIIEEPENLPGLNIEPEPEAEEQTPEDDLNNNFMFEPEPELQEPEDIAEAMTEINEDDTEDFSDMDEESNFNMNIEDEGEPVNEPESAPEGEEEFAPWLTPGEGTWTPALEQENNNIAFEDESLNNNNSDRSGEDAQREKDMGLRERMLNRKNGGADAAANNGSNNAKGSGWIGRALMTLLLLLLVIGAGMCWWELRNLNLNLSKLAGLDNNANSGVSSETALRIQNLLSNIESQNKEIKPYEYAIEFLVDNNIVSGIAARGANGWQIVGSRRSQDTASGQYGYEFIFMRPLVR
ncbi:MAG: hypothetical protein IJQ63_05010 [Synergistaceae bacterium]|nr:hypothetical protein [Synergistaceae bacterium]